MTEKEVLKAFIYFLFLSLLFFSRNIVSGKSYTPFSLLNLWNRNPPQKELGHLPQMDALVIFYANDSLYNEMLKKGEILKWNPYIFSGHPVYANGHSSFHNPFRLLFNLLFPSVFARDFTIFFHMLLAGIFCFLFLREMGFSFYPSLFGGTVWEFCGHNTALIEWMWGAMAGAYLPMLLFFFSKTLKTGKGYHFVLTAISFSLSLMCGNLQWSLYIFISWFIFYAIYTYDFIRKKELRNFFYLTALFTGAFLFGFILSSIEIIPTIEFLRYSSLQRESLSYETYRTDFITKYTIFTSLLYPRLTGSPVDPINLRAIGIMSHYLINGYIGILPLFFLFYGIFHGWRRREVKVLTIVFILSWLIALRTFLVVPLLKLPLFNRLFHDRILFIASFCGIVLSTEGFELLRGRLKKGTPILIIFPLIFIALSIALFIIWRDTLPSSWFSPLTTALNIPFLLLLSSFFLILGRLRGMKKNGFIIFSFLFTISDLIPMGMLLNSTDPPDPLRVLSEIKEDLQTENWERISGIRQNLSVLLKIPSPEGYDSIYPDWYFKALYPRVTRKEMRWEVSMVMVPPSFMRLLGVRFYISNGELQPVKNPSKIPEGTFLKFLKFLPSGLALYEVENPFPRTFVPERFVITNEKKCLEFLHTDGFNPSEFLILTEIPDEFPSQGMKGTARILSYEPHRVLIEAEMETDGFLVLTDTYYPGWKVYVDGRERRIYRAYSFLRAVEVPEGHHEVLFLFKPQTYKAGKILTFLGLFLLIPFFLIRFYPFLQEELAEKKGYETEEKKLWFIPILLLLSGFLFLASINWWKSVQELKASKWHFYRGVLEFQNGNREVATSLFQRALSYRTFYPLAYTYLGDSLKEEGRYEEAISAYEKARSWYPFSFETYVALASIYKTLGMDEKLRRLSDELERFRKKWASVMERDGFALLVEGEIELAVKSFLSAIILDTRREEAYYGLSLAYYLKGSLKEALKAIDSAISLSPRERKYQNFKNRILEALSTER